MSSSPRRQPKPPRPKITLPVPGQFPGHYAQTPIGYLQTPYGQTPMPMTPNSGQPTIVYPRKSSGFVITHLKGFKDWTKSGLSVGEKSAFWLYEKVSSWSKRWFTHIFLFFVLFLYSVLGAFLFQCIEGENESAIQEDIRKERDEMIQQIRDLWKEKELVDDSDKWKGRAKNHLMLYEEKLYQFLKKLNFQSRPDNLNWAFWNAVIYCSTIYTTIADEESCSMDEEEERRARMERMVEDTERMELMAEQDRRSRSTSRPPESSEPVPVAKTRARSPVVNRPEKLEGTMCEDKIKVHEASSQEKPESLVTKIPEESLAIKKSQSPSKIREQTKEIEQPSQIPIKTSRKVRESSDDTEHKKRMGSPDITKTRSSRALSPPPIDTESNDNQQVDARNTKKRTSRHQRHRDVSENDEPPTVLAQQQRSHRSPSQPIKKQIIPLNNDSLIEDVARAKRAYIQREPTDNYEYEDDDMDEEEEYLQPRRKRETNLRRRKASVIHSDEEKEEISKSVNQSSSWFSWIPFFGKRRQQVDEMINKSDKEKKKEADRKNEDAFLAKAKLEKSASIATEPPSDKVTFREIFASIRDITGEFNEFCLQNPKEVQILLELRNLCIIETIITIIICGLGGFAFRFTEGAFESFYKCGVKRVKRDFLDSLWNFSHNMKEDDWKSMARRKLMEFEEQLHAAHEAGVQTYSGQKSWTFLNSMVYCLTVITTIGYGHISPSTTTGRALTIIYAIFGIPMFLIVLADFGKLFTRGIKFLWAFVRRLYYTGSCRKVRRTVPMQEMMKGVQMVYDLATFRRPSQMSPEELVEIQRQQQQTVLGLDGSTPQQPESPSTPAMSAFEVDDEFNLPISVAITILVLYIFIGATMFNIFEDWTFFESFYFVFISMSTIGFGDFVPNDPIYMMLSIVYLIFGLALTSMCINVVQVMLTDQFKHASQKIGASIGFQVSEEDGSLKPVPPEPIEVPEVHSATADTKKKENIAPKAKQEDVDL